MKCKRVTVARPRKPPGFLPRPYAHLGTAHSFLFHLTGLDPETDAVGLDHAYAKSWASHPESSMAKSMVTLFLTPGIRSTNSLKYRANVGGGSGSNADLDVESVEPHPPPAYDVPKARTAMKECEVGLAFVRDKEIGEDDWEDKVNKSGWTSSQSRLFNKVVRELVGDKLARLAIVSSDNEPLQLRLQVDKTAKRFRDILATVQWEKKMCSWLHRIILDHMPTSFLMAYLDVLQSLKCKIPTLIDRLLCGTPLPSSVDAKANPKSPPPTPKSPPSPSPKSPPLSSSLPTGVIDPESLANLLKRPWDPLGGLFVHQRLRKIPANPIILMAPDAPSNLSSSTSVKRKKFWHSQLSSLGKIIPINSGVHSSSSGAHTGAVAQQSLENMINAMRAKVCHLREHYAPQERPIVLMGWGVGALVCLQVSLVETVSAVVCLGLPFLGIDGTRGDVDDPLLELRTPTLFILGQLAPLSPLADIEDLREKVKAETFLVLVGGADDQLRMCRQKKKLEGITQSIVDRCVQDEILDFLLGVFAATSQEKSSASHHSLLVGGGVGIGSNVETQSEHIPANDSNNGALKSTAPPLPLVSGVNKSRKRPNNRDEHVPSRVSSVDSKYPGGVPLGASKSAPDIPVSTSDDPITQWRPPSSERSMQSLTFTSSPSLASISSSSAATNALSLASSSIFSSATSSTSLNVKSGIGSRGKVKAKKQGGSSKKVSKQSRGQSGYGVFNVTDNSKVYGLPPTHAPSSIRPLLSPTFLNPATQPLTTGATSMGAPRLPVSYQPETNVNVPKSTSMIQQNSKPLVINSATLSAMERGSNRVLSSSEYIGVSSSSASPFPTQHHLLTMSSSKPMAPPSLASFRPSLAGALNPPFSVPDSSSTSSSLQSPSLQSASSPLIRLPADCSVSRPKTSTIPGATHPPIGNVRQPVSIKRPVISHQASPEGKGGELGIEELRRQVHTQPKPTDKLVRPLVPKVRALSKSTDRMPIQPPLPQAPRTSISATSLSHHSPPPAHPLHQSKSSSHIGSSQQTPPIKSSSSQASSSKAHADASQSLAECLVKAPLNCSPPKSQSSDISRPQLMRKSVITSAVKQDNPAVQKKQNG